MKKLLPIRGNILVEARGDFGGRGATGNGTSGGPNSTSASGKPCCDCFAILHREPGDDVRVYVVHQAESRIKRIDRVYLLGTKQQAKHFEAIQTMNNRDYLWRGSVPC